MHDDPAALPVIDASTGCACGDDDHDVPVLDARAIPHSIRHATVLGALDSLASHGALILVAPHDPLPLLAQARARYPEGLDVEYLEQGPEAWRIRLRRR